MGWLGTFGVDVGFCMRKRRLGVGGRRKRDQRDIEREGEVDSCRLTKSDSSAKR